MSIPIYLTAKKASKENRKKRIIFGEPGVTKRDVRFIHLSFFANMEAYLGSTSLSRQYLPMIPKELMERKTTALGVSVYKMNL